MRLPTLLMLLPLAALPTSARALGIRIADQNPFATARGNAFAATADHPSALYYNPAGITQLKGHNAAAGIYAISLDSTFESPQGFERDTRDELLALGNFYYVYGSRKLPLALGFGSYSPYGLGLEWPDDTGFRHLAKEGRLLYATVNPVIAWQVHRTLSIGAGATLNYGDVKLVRGIFVPGDEFKFKGHDADVGFNAGLLWQPHRKHAFGVSYRSATTLEFEGHSRVHLVAPFTFRGSESARARFHFPQHVIAGWSFRPTENWNFEFNADWTDWDSLNTVTLRQASGDLALPFNWRSSFFYEFGATRYLAGGWRVSAGYIFSENSVPEESFNPAVPDSDRHIFSVGVGRKVNRLSWDAAYQLAYGPSRAIGTGTAADGRYTFLSHALTIAIGYSF